MRKALLPKFQVGEPLNGRLWKGVPYCVGLREGHPCRVPGVDYSGADPNVQFPRDWHVNVGPRDGNQMGGYHQDPLRFEPDRVRVVDGAVRLLAGMPGRHGGAEVTRPLDTPVAWADGHALKLVVEFMPTEEVPCALFDNIELRGVRVPMGKPHSEPALVFGFLMSSVKRAAYWWHDRSESSALDDRTTYTQNVKLAVGCWHRLAVTLTPGGLESQWDLKLRLRISGRAVWNLDVTGDAPNGVLAIHGVMFGNEHSLARNESGGVWFYRKVQAWVLEG